MEHPLILSFCQTWQLYAGLTHSTNSNNHLQALSSTQAVFSSPAVSTVTNRQVSTHSPPNVHSTDTNKERKKSTETRQAERIFINHFCCCCFLPTSVKSDGILLLRAYQVEGRLWKDTCF